MKRFKKYLIPVTIGLFSLLLLQPKHGRAQKDKASITQLLEKRDAEIKELMGPKGTEYTQQQREELKNIINSIIDYRAMAKYALGNTYDDLSAAERDEFVDLFSTIIRDHSLNKLDIYRAKVNYKEIAVDDNTAEVKTMAQLEDVRTPVGYTMEYKDNEWVVTDMIIDDVSTAESYNRQFQKIIRKKGYDSLLENLRKRAAK